MQGSQGRWCFLKFHSHILTTLAAAERTLRLQRSEALHGQEVWLAPFRERLLERLPPYTPGHLPHTREPGHVGEPTNGF